MQFKIIDKFNEISIRYKLLEQHTFLNPGKVGTEKVIHIYALKIK